MTCSDYHRKKLLCLSTTRVIVVIVGSLTSTRSAVARLGANQSDDLHEVFERTTVFGPRSSRSCETQGANFQGGETGGLSSIKNGSGPKTGTPTATNNTTSAGLARPCYSRILVVMSCSEKFVNKVGIWGGGDGSGFDGSESIKIKFRFHGRYRLATLVAWDKMTEISTSA